jgi:hypothetical protein
MRLLALLCNTSKLRCCIKRKKLLACGKLLLASGFFRRRDVRMFLNKEHQTLLALSSVLFKNHPQADSKAHPTLNCLYYPFRTHSEDVGSLLLVSSEHFIFASPIHKFISKEYLNLLLHTCVELDLSL